MLPSKQQWAKWTLPSKYSLIGLFLGIIGIVIGLYSLTFGDQELNYEQPYVAKRISRIEFLTQTIDRLLPDIELIEPVRDPYLDI